MNKGVTYTAVDSRGHAHTRYSVGHTGNKYPYAVVKIPGDISKATVSFRGSRQLAEKALRDVLKHVALPDGGGVRNGMKIGELYYPNAEIVETTHRYGR